MHPNILSHITSWNESSVYGDESKSLKWIEVIILKSLGLQLGISFNGYWVRISNNLVYEFSSGCSYRFLYPVIELRLLDVQKAIIDGLNYHHLPLGFLDNFPFENIVISGLSSNSEYWCNLALKYIEDLEIDEEIINALNICSKNAPTQKLRHQAKKLWARNVSSS